MKSLTNIVESEIWNGVSNDVMTETDACFSHSPLSWWWRVTHVGIQTGVGVREESDWNGAWPLFEISLLFVCLLTNNGLSVSLISGGGLGTETESSWLVMMKWNTELQKRPCSALPSWAVQTYHLYPLIMVSFKHWPESRYLWNIDARIPVQSVNAELRCSWTSLAGKFKLNH